MQAKPHWISDTDCSSGSFFIHRMESVTPARTNDIPQATIPLIGFIYVTRGEVLVEADGNPFLCQPGHALIIPENCPFSVRYYREATGYTGAFSTSLLTDTKPLRFLTKPVHQAFWFDEGVFMGELFNMMMTSFDKGDDVFIEKALDLFLSRIKSGNSVALPDSVSLFLESVFDNNRPTGTLETYAQAAGISKNHLSRQVKQFTGRSVGDWIDSVRIVKAKRLLAGTSAPIIDVAAAVGIDDQSYFARFFKSKTGQTPTEFRKAMQEKS